MATLRLCCGVREASLRGEKGLALRQRPIRCSLSVQPKDRQTTGAMPRPTTIPYQRKFVVCRCSDGHKDHDHACDETSPFTLLVRPCRRRGLDDDGNEETGKRGGGGTSPEKIDRWMQECIVEIVRNIGKAPFLVTIFCNSGGAALKLDMEAADPENWDAIRNRWTRGVTPPPDGVILVEELQIRNNTGDSTFGGGKPGNPEGAASSKTWGVLVQGLGGVDSAACYILSTCRVRSVFGFCTHFCLTRARCFEDTVDMQLKKLWLVQEGMHNRR